MITLGDLKALKMPDSTPIYLDGISRGSMARLISVVSITREDTATKTREDQPDSIIVEERVGIILARD